MEAKKKQKQPSRKGPKGTPIQSRLPNIEAKPPEPPRPSSGPAVLGSGYTFGAPWDYDE